MEGSYAVRSDGFDTLCVSTPACKSSHNGLVMIVSDCSGFRCGIESCDLDLLKIFPILIVICTWIVEKQNCSGFHFTPIFWMKICSVVYSVWTMVTLIVDIQFLRTETSLATNTPKSPTLRVRAFFSQDCSGLPRLLYLYNWFHVSDYRNFWNTERWKSFN